MFAAGRSALAFDPQTDHPQEVLRVGNSDGELFRRADFIEHVAVTCERCAEAHQRELFVEFATADCRVDGRRRPFELRIFPGHHPRCIAHDCRVTVRDNDLGSRVTQVAEWIAENAWTADWNGHAPEGLLVDDCMPATRFQNWFHGLGLQPGCPGRKSGRAWPIFKSWGRCGGPPPQNGEGRTK